MRHEIPPREQALQLVRKWLVTFITIVPLFHLARPWLSSPPTACKALVNTANAKHRWESFLVSLRLISQCPVIKWVLGFLKRGRGHIFYFHADVWVGASSCSFLDVLPSPTVPLFRCHILMFQTASAALCKCHRHYLVFMWSDLVGGQGQGAHRTRVKVGTSWAQQLPD